MSWRDPPDRGDIVLGAVWMTVLIVLMMLALPGCQMPLR